MQPIASRREPSILWKSFFHGLLPCPDSFFVKILLNENIFSFPRSEKKIFESDMQRLKKKIQLSIISKKDTFGKINYEYHRDEKMLHVRSLSSYLINFVYTSLSTVLLSNHPRSSLFKKKEKNTYTLRKTGINYANKQEKKRICDDVPKLNCAKGLGKGVGVQILFSLFPRGILDFLFR